MKRNPVTLSTMVVVLAVIISLQERAVATGGSSHNQPISAVMRGHTVDVSVAGKLFTSYLFDPNWKYPYFYPVIGPGSGKSVTTRRTEPWPHHSSLFFGCDRVNGGNYWQGPLRLGQIRPLRTCVRKEVNEVVVIEQRCRWDRPGAPSPFEDSRRIRIWAPSPRLRMIEFDITLTALTNVVIYRSNHSLFAARMAPDLAVNGGGVLINAQGEQGEKATWGKRSPWMDSYGERGGIIEGLAILDHPKNPWYPSPWFTRNYGFFSPTPMNWLPQGKLLFQKGQKLHLRYLVVAHEGKLQPKDFDSLLQSWAKGDFDKKP